MGTGDALNLPVAGSTLQPALNLAFGGYNDGTVSVSLLTSTPCLSSVRPSTVILHLHHYLYLIFAAY